MNHGDGASPQKRASRPEGSAGGETTASEVLRRIDAFGHHLVAAMVNLEMHASDSQIVADRLRLVQEQLEKIFESRPTPSRPLVLSVHGDQLSYEGHNLVGASLQASRLLRACRERRVRALTFDPRVTQREVRELLQLLRDDSARSAFAPQFLEAALASRGIVHAGVRLETRDGSESGTPRGGGDALRRYQAMTDFLQDNHVAAYRGHELEMERAAGLVEQAIDEIDLEPSGLLALATYDDIDSFTVGHSVRVCLLALQVALATGADRRTLLRVGTAALLHDVGKSRIPQEILFKRGPLDAAEREIMKEHARLGGEILLEQSHVDPTAIGAAYCHHMGPNGAGYPAPLLPFEPSGISKLVRVCDVFEALTAVRPYKPALTTIQAYTIMHRMREAFDAAWLRFFTRVIGLFPLGTHVVLGSGEKAVVVGRGPSLSRPRVRVVRDSSGNEVAPHEQRVMLADGTEAASTILAIQGCEGEVAIPEGVLDTIGVTACTDSSCGHGAGARA